MSISFLAVVCSANSAAAEKNDERAAFIIRMGSESSQPSPF
jgi:hypothetical protein